MLFCRIVLRKKNPGEVEEKLSLDKEFKEREAGMEKDCRYKLEHMGDSFVEMLAKVSCASKSSARGVVLTYDIRQLTKRKEALIREMGMRVAQIGKDNPSLAQDEKIIELLGRLDETDKRLSSYIGERQQLLSFGRKSRVETTTTGTPQNA